MQRHGYGQRAVRAAIAMLNGQHGYKHFALSYQPDNLAAKSLYETLGFVETNDREEDEIIARLALSE